jgi:hypothetical protein
MAVETKISVELPIPSWIPPRLWNDYARCVTSLLKSNPLEHAEALAEDAIRGIMKLEV